MTVTVEQVVIVNAITAPTTTVTISATVNTGDTIVVLAGSPDNDTNITAASGCGATWAALGHDGANGTGAVIGWIGRGATTNGNISLTFTSSRGGTVRAFLLRGLNGDNVSWAAVSGSSTSIAGPMHPVGPGQIILGIGLNIYSTLTLAQTSGSWTQQAVYSPFGSVNTQYLTPSSDAYYGQIVNSSSSYALRLAQVVVGTSTDTQPAVTVFESRVVATSAVTVTAPVNSGDQLIVTATAIDFDSDITAVSGCGATWSTLGHAGGTGSGAVAGWVGVNPTTQGAVSVTMSSSRGGVIRVFVVHGGNGSTTTWNATTASSTTVNGPSATVGLGQTVIAQAIMQGAGTNALTAVSGSWTTQTQFPASTGAAVNTAYAAPSSSGTYQQSAVQSSSGSARVAQIVLGDVISVKHGSGTGAFTWAGSAAGSRDPEGAGTGAYAWAGSGVGSNDAGGFGTGAYAWAGTASGSTDHGGAGTGAYAWAGAAAGTTPGIGNYGTGTYNWTGAATGHNGVVTLMSWDTDVSQQSIIPVDSPPSILIVTTPLPDIPDGLSERAIPIESHILPALTPDADGRVRHDGLHTITHGTYGIPHITVDGVDVTYFRDSPTILGEIVSSEPGGEDYASINFPQITAFDTRGTGDLDWLYPDAPVEIFVLHDDDSRTHQFSGHLVGDDTGVSDGLRSTWQAQGNIRQAAETVHRVPTILPPTDIGTLIAATYNNIVGRQYGTLTAPSTGINSKLRGSYSDFEDDYAQNLLAKAWTAGGNQWTLNRDGVNQYKIALKDLTTEHWTVTAGTPGIGVELSQDWTSVVNCIYGRGVASNGYAWAGWCHPNVLPDTAPIYPMFPITDLIEVGVDDGDTTTGTGVSDWQRRVQSLGYAVTVDGVYSAADALVCRQVQTDYGLLVDGKVGPQTWAASFDVGSGGGDLSGSYRRPLAIVTEVDPYLYSASGAIVGANPSYDNGTTKRRERNIDYGTNISKADATVDAQREIARNADPGWQGTITFETDPQEGSKFDILEGQNIKLLGFRGGTVLLHIAEAHKNFANLTVTCTVDTRARDAMSLSSIAERDRDAKADPALRPGNPQRRSRQEQDMAVEFDGESGAGIIPRFAVYGGLWSVIRIPVSETGTIKLLEATTSGPECPFVVWIFGQPVTPAHMNTLGGTNPLVDEAPLRDNADILDEQYAFIDAFGTPGEPGGYFPGSKSQGDPVTGRLKDSGGFEYKSAKPPHLWIAVYAESTCFIEGRLWPAPVV